MSRETLPEAQIHPAIRDRLAAYRRPLVASTQAALDAHPVLVVGMAGNPFVRRARRALDGAGVAHHYIGLGSYLGRWRDRLALKLWTGWPTFPMVFVRGTLVGGATDVERLLASGELQRLLQR